MAKTTFIGRQQELSELGSLFEKKSASLVVLHGRRRIGKSSLVYEFAKGHRFLSFSGLPPRPDTTAQDERNVFTRQLSAQTPLPNLKVDDWSEIFQLLATQVTQGRTIVLFDEISWMGQQDPDFLGKLKDAWDKLFSTNPELILILCGSVSLWIEKNILSSTGFMGRVSLDINLNELSLEDCNQLLIKKKVKANAYEKFKLLSVTGGVPRYINEIKPNLSADDNIRQLCFISSGILFREFDDIFHDLFSRESEYYKKMVQILVNGSLEYTDICEQLGLEKSGYWSCYLDELVKAGFLKKAFTWNIKTGKISRFNQYRLSDNYLRFYLKYIAPNKVKIANHLFAEKQLHSLPAWDSIIGLQFENLVLNNARRIWKKLHISANDIIAHGPYFQKKNQRVSGCQIDYLIETRHNTLIVCEIKFSKSALDTTVIKAMQEKIAALQTPKGYACWPVLICVNGVSDAVLEADYFTHIIHFADFLGEN